MSEVIKAKFHAYSADFCPAKLSDFFVRNEASLALWEAAGGGQAEIVRLLLRYTCTEVDFVHQERTPLLRAIERRSLDTVLALLQAGADANRRVVIRYEARSPLGVASILGDVDVVRALIRAGADLDGALPTTPCFRAVKSPLYYAFESRNFRVVLALVDAGARPWKNMQITERPGFVYFFLSMCLSGTLRLLSLLSHPELHPFVVAFVGLAALFSLVFSLCVFFFMRPVLKLIFELISTKVGREWREIDAVLNEQ